MKVDFIQNLSMQKYSFHSSTVRREDFIAVTCSPLMPLKFSSYRRVEKVSVCEQVITILPGVVKYVAAVDAKMRIIQ